MPTHPSTAWKTLLATPAPSSTGKMPAKSARLATQKEANLSLWAAIDRNDATGVGAAMASGAALTNRRKGATPLWQAVANGQWEIAERLREAGADIHTQTQSSLTLLDALFDRDQAEEAERLLGWGCDPTRTTGDNLVLRHGAPRLLLWWLEHGNLAKIPRAAKGDGIKSTVLGSIVCWAATAARGSDELRAHLGKAWGVRSWDPEHFAYAFPRTNAVAVPVWNLIFQRDDVEMARGCLLSGWGPPARTKEAPNMFLWQAAHAGAWNLVAWFRSVPEFRKAMEACAKQEPEQWWRCGHSGTQLTKLATLGMDFQQVDREGDTIAHHLLAQPGVKPALVDWFVKHQPKLLSQPNTHGATPLAVIHASTILVHAQASLLEQDCLPATARKTTARL